MPVSGSVGGRVGSVSVARSSGAAKPTYGYGRGYGKSYGKR